MTFRPKPTATDFARARDHLAQANSHVEMGKRHIERQHRMLAELKRDGHDTRSATELLSIFEQLQAMHIAHRDRLQEEFAAVALMRFGRHEFESCMRLGNLQPR